MWGYRGDSCSPACDHAPQRFDGSAASCGSAVPALCCCMWLTCRQDLYLFMPLICAQSELKQESWPRSLWVCSGVCCLQPNCTWEVLGNALQIMQGTCLSRNTPLRRELVVGPVAFTALWLSSPQQW